MSIVSHLHQLFNPETYQSYIHPTFRIGLLIFSRLSAYPGAVL